MTKKYFILHYVGIVSLIFILTGVLLYRIIDTDNKLNTVTAKNKLLRRALHNFQWEVTQAHNRNQELDELRWMRRATELRHADWALITKTIYRKAKEYGLRPDLILAIAHRESNFQPYAASFCAMGVMQINYSVWAEPLGLTLENIYDIENNIDAGCVILRMYLNETGGDEAKALLYYNCGYRLVNPRYVPRVKSSMFYKGGGES